MARSETFLMEGYWPEPGGRPDPARLAEAAEALGGGTVRYLGSVTVPSDETVFWLFEATSRAALQAAAAVAGMTVDRIVPATTQGAVLATPIPIAEESIPASPAPERIDR